MNTLNIGNREYVIIPRKEYERIRVKTASKNVPVKKLSLRAGKKLAHKLIDKWAKER